MPDLGKYGVEVLSAYGVTLVLLGGVIWATWRAAAASEKRLKEAEDRQRG